MICVGEMQILLISCSEAQKYFTLKRCGKHFKWLDISKRIATTNDKEINCRHQTSTMQGCAAELSLPKGAMFKWFNFWFGRKEPFRVSRHWWIKLLACWILHQAPTARISENIQEYPTCWWGFREFPGVSENIREWNFWIKGCDVGIRALHCFAPTVSTRHATQDRKLFIEEIIYGQVEMQSVMLVQRYQFHFIDVTFKLVIEFFLQNFG